MKITIESTSKVVLLDVGHGCVVPARIWEGSTDSGIHVHCFVTRIAVPRGEDTTQFDKELQEQRAPSARVPQYPVALVL